MSEVKPVQRRKPGRNGKREAILSAAREVFEAEGLEGASLRAIARAAGYTPAALYFHFDSKEAVYAALLAESLDRLRQAVETAAGPGDPPEERFLQSGMAFFEFYAAHPRDLDLGFYLFRSGMRPHGLGRDADSLLNRQLEAALAPIGSALRDLGLGEAAARRRLASCFAHASGLLLLHHTGRIRLLGQDARHLMNEFLNETLAALAED